MAIGSRNVFSAVYSFVCLVVCFYQIFSLFRTYTQYDVRSRLKLKIPDPLPVPDLTICVRYTDVIDLGKLGHKNNRSLVRGYTVSAIREIQEISTVADVLKLTPREDALLGKCMFRKPKKYSPEIENGDLCIKFFTATKFVTQEFVCYKLSATLKILFDYGTLTSSLSWPGLLYSVTFKKFSWIRDLGIMKVAVHSKVELPYTSLGMGSLTTNRRNTNSQNHITLSYKTVNVSALEFPYKTGCRRTMPNGQPYSKQDCFNECLISLTNQKFQKGPFSILIQEPVDMLTIPSSQISNDSFSDSLSRIEIECTSKCKYIDCDYDYTMTLSSYQESDELHFVVTAPSEPTVRIEFQKQMDLNDLIYYSMSLLSFWFGISVISFNPAPFIASHYPSCARIQEVERENFGFATKFCKNTRTNLLRGLKSELKFLSDDIFFRKWEYCRNPH